MAENLNPNTAEKAEQARREREAPAVSNLVRAKVGRTPVVVGEKVYEPAATFEAPMAVLHNAIGRGLVEKVEPRAKR